MELSELLFSGIGIAALVFFWIFVITSYVLIKFANRTEQDKKLDTISEQLISLNNNIKSLIAEIRADREARNDNGDDKCVSS